MVEIEWCYQEYDNYGNLIFEEYVFSTFECWGGSGGGGGTGPNPAELCQIRMNSFVSQGSPVSQLRSSTITYEDAFGYKKVEDWKIYSAGTWGLISIEDAEIVNVPLPHGGFIREYGSFTRRIVFSVGTSIGGTRSFQDLGASINLTKSRAEVRIDYTVTHTAAGCISPLTINFNANHAFNVLKTVSIE